MLFIALLPWLGVTMSLLPTFHIFLVKEAIISLQKQCVLVHK